LLVWLLVLLLLVLRLLILGSLLLRRLLCDWLLTRRQLLARLNARVVQSLSAVEAGCPTGLGWAATGWADDHRFPLNRTIHKTRRLLKKCLSRHWRLRLAIFAPANN
jgi:hypothetical protein